MAHSGLQKGAGLGIAVLDHLPEYLGVYVLNGNFFVVCTSHHLGYLLAGARHDVLVRRNPFQVVRFADDEHYVTNGVVFESLMEDLN